MLCRYYLTSKTKKNPPLQCFGHGLSCNCVNACDLGSELNHVIYIFFNICYIYPAGHGVLDEAQMHISDSDSSTNCEKMQSLLMMKNVS